MNFISMNQQSSIRGSITLYLLSTLGKKQANWLIETLYSGRRQWEFLYEKCLLERIESTLDVIDDPDESYEQELVYFTSPT